MKWSNWGEDAPPQEERAKQPDEPRHRAPSGKYKDKKVWCRGKIGGQRHTGVIELRRASWSAPDAPDCFFGQLSVREWYHCDHQLICSNPMCRKVLKWSLDATECPTEPKVRFNWRTRQVEPYDERNK
jgi:hypothetical protein